MLHTGEHLRVKHQYVRSRCPRILMKGKKPSDASTCVSLHLLPPTFNAVVVLCQRYRSQSWNGGSKKSTFCPEQWNITSMLRSLLVERGTLSHWDFFMFRLAFKHTPTCCARTMYEWTWDYDTNMQQIFSCYSTKYDDSMNHRDLRDPPPQPPSHSWPAKPALDGKMTAWLLVHLTRDEWLT